MLDGEIVGFLAFDPGCSWLRQIFVRPSAKHSGVGTALLDIAKREMSGGFWLWTDAENKVVYLWP